MELFSGRNAINRWIGRLAVLLLSIAASSTAPPVRVALADETPVSVVSVVVKHTWPRVCEIQGKCWRQIAMNTDGTVEFFDEQESRQAEMSAESLASLQEILESDELLLALANPLAPECEGWDGIHDTDIRVEFSNGASMGTKWAAGCLSIPGHPFGEVNDLAVRQRVEHIECTTFESALCEEGFDFSDYWSTNDVIFGFNGQSKQGLCFPCCGEC